MTKRPLRLVATPRDESDESLVERFKSGDTEAFSPLLSRYRDRIYSYVMARVREKERAADLTQDVFLKAIQRIDQFEGKSLFSTWLYAIARNVCIDHSRKMQFRRHKSLDQDDEGSPWVERVASASPGAARSAMATRFRQELRSAVQALPDDQREVFLLRQIEGMAFQEISRTLEIPENTAKSRMRYALKRLQEALRPYRDYLREERIL